MTKDTRPNVLFVDDQFNILRLLTKLFEKEYSVITAESVDDAIKILDESQIDLVVTDYEMPDKDGMQMLEYVNKHHSHIKKIMMTGNIDRSLVIDAINVGLVDNFISKPIKFEELKVVINDLYKKLLEEKQIEKDRVQDGKLADKYRADIEERNQMLYDTIHTYDRSKVDVFSEKISKVISNYYDIAKSSIKTFTEGTQDQEALNILMIINILQDIDLIASEFRFKAIQLLNQLILVYLGVMRNDTHDTLSNFQRVYGLYSQIDDKKIKEVVKSSIDELKEYLKPGFEVDEHITDIPGKILLLLESIVIEDFVKLDLSDIKIPDAFPKISLLLVLNDNLPVYIFDKKELNVSATLASNFIQALTLFSKELFNSDGSLKTIQHESAVILIHQIGDLTYVIISPIETLQLRMAFREFANQTKDIFKKVRSGRIITEKDPRIIKLIGTYFLV